MAYTNIDTVSRLGIYLKIYALTPPYNNKVCRPKIELQLLRDVRAIKPQVQQHFKAYKRARLLFIYVSKTL